MRQSQWREQSEWLGSSYHQIKYIQKAIPHAHYIMTCDFYKVFTLEVAVEIATELKAATFLRRWRTQGYMEPKNMKEPGVVLRAKSLQEFCWWFIGCYHKSLTWLQGLCTLLSTPFFNLIFLSYVLDHSHVILIQIDLLVELRKNGLPSSLQRFALEFTST